MLAHGSSAVSSVPYFVATLLFLGVTKKQQLALRYNPGTLGWLSLLGTAVKSFGHVRSGNFPL